MQDKYIGITELTKYIKNKFENDSYLNSVYIKGEISNFKAHTSGHYYFSLKDEGSKINAIMFSSSVKNVLFTPTDGMKVLVRGRISIYEATGMYQIYIEEMVEDGLGNLYIAYEQLKKKLAAEGLFNEEHKKKIPKIPKRVGIVTAATGAAVKDIISTIKRRFPICETVLFPSLVQGDGAKEDLVKQINRAEGFDIDILIIGRGGGSIEDLWPFNEEIVARAIYESKIPIISAVGHEIDFTISDFVADLRAPTPTAAAELAVPNISDIINFIDNIKIRGYEALIKKITVAKSILDQLKNSYILLNPMRMYEAKIQKLDHLKDKLIKIASLTINNNKHLIENIIGKLGALNPKNVLKRGFAIVKLNDKNINEISELTIGDTIDIELNKGKIKSQIIEMEKRNEL